MTPIIDAHHHIWRRVRLPWLVEPMLPRIFGPYEPLQRDYPIEEFLHDITGYGIEKSVWTSYAELIAAYRKAADRLSPDDQQAIFHDAASRVYWLGQQERLSQRGENHAA